MRSTSQNATSLRAIPAESESHVATPASNVYRFTDYQAEASDRTSYPRRWDIVRDAEERQRLAKERELPPEKRGELDAWIDAALIATGNERLLRSLSSISDEVFGSFWDNPIDAEYDKL